MSLLKFAAPLSFALALSAMKAMASPALDQIARQVSESARSGQNPVVVYDLDDTLFDSRTRFLAIQDDFASDPEIRARFPRESRILLETALSEIRFRLDDTLRGLGITDETFSSLLRQRWQASFFGNEYCRSDRTIAGAITFAHALHDAGARIVYLTGRDEPRMGRCTREALAYRGFPTGTGTELMMKPDASMTDLDYKREAFERIARMGTVVAGFENEPVNANALAERFQGARIILLRTMHSGKPVQPKPEITWVDDYR